MAKKLETLKIEVHLLTDKRKDELAERVHNYLRGMSEYVDNKVILNKDARKTIQIFFDSDVNRTAMDDIYDIVVDFIS